MKVEKKSRPTLGLAMIMKDETEDLDRIIKDYGKYFDKIYVTVTDKKTYTKLLHKLSKSKKLEISYFKWIDHFGKARNYNLQQVKTDYWMWIDLDDEIVGAKNIPGVVEHMVAKGVNAAWFKYDYIRRLNLTEPGSIVWRERIIKTASGLKWRDDAVHETVDDPGNIKQELLSVVTIVHRQTAEHTLISAERNRLILEKDWQRTHRAETAYYLGEHAGALGDYEGAIEKLLFAATHTKSKMFKFIAWQNLFICYYQTAQYDKALATADECIAVDQDHPDPWFHKFMAYWALGNHVSAMQSAEVAMSKRGNGERAILKGTDPSLSQYKGPLNVAQAYLSLGSTERAYQIYSEVKRIAPGYIKEQSVARGVQLEDVFEKAYSKVNNRVNLVK